MAKAKSMKCAVINGCMVWMDRTTNKSLFSFDMSTVHADLETSVREYGIKQIIADGGTGDKIDTLDQRLAAMAERAAKLVDGSYGTREVLMDGDIFRAMIAVRGLTDSPELRAKWKSLDAKQRRAIGDRPDVRAKMETVPVADTDDLLDSMMD